MSQISKQRDGFNTVHHLSLAYMGINSTNWLLAELLNEFFVNKHHKIEDFQEYLDNQSILTLLDVILIEADTEGECFRFIQKIKKNILYRELIIVLIAPEKDKALK